MKKGFFIFVTFAALALASEIEDGDQKKRGAGKANVLNGIPTGGQKPDYTYNIYSQNPGVQVPSQTYQGQTLNTFYPNQVASQYYAPSNNPDPSTSNSLHTQVSPQISTPTTQTHFVPINLIPNTGYQPKFHLVSPKTGGNLQLAIIQQPAIQPSSILQYPQSIFSPSNTNHVTPHSAILGSQGHYSFGSAFHPLSLGGSFIHPSMVLLPQPHANLYNNLVYPNPAQSLYNYYPSTQAKYSYASGASVSQSNDFEKSQSTAPQSLSKEDNINVQSTDYLTPPDTSSGYKDAYTSRSSYSKL